MTARELLAYLQALPDDELDARVVINDPGASFASQADKLALHPPTETSSDSPHGELWING